MDEKDGTAPVPVPSSGPTLNAMFHVVLDERDRQWQLRYDAVIKAHREALDELSRLREENKQLLKRLQQISEGD